MIAGVTLSGVGAGLSVLVAQTALRERQQLFLRRALFLGLAVSAPVGIAAAAAGSVFSERLGGAALSAQSVVLAALAGWIALIHGLVNSYWQGQQRRDLMLALAFGSAALALAAAVFAPQAFVMELIILAHAAPAVVLLFVPYRSTAPQRAKDRALERYVLPGLAIGILSPASMIVARSLVADALSWHESGVLQALFRISDWICVFAGGVLSVFYLPRFAAASPRGGLDPLLRESARTIMLPSVLLFFVLFAFPRAAARGALRLELPGLAARGCTALRGQRGAHRLLDPALRPVCRVAHARDRRRGAAFAAAFRRAGLGGGRAADARDRGCPLARDLRRLRHLQPLGAAAEGLTPKTKRLATTIVAARK